MLVLQNSDKVILIFSVNMSGFFQGYAQMMSPVGWRRDNVWSQGIGKSNPWGRSFKVKWLQLNDLPFQKTLYKCFFLFSFFWGEVFRTFEASLRR